MREGQKPVASESAFAGRIMRSVKPIVAATRAPLMKIPTQTSFARPRSPSRRMSISSALSLLESLRRSSSFLALWRLISVTVDCQLLSVAPTTWVGKKGISVTLMSVLVRELATERRMTRYLAQRASSVNSLISSPTSLLSGMRLRHTGRRLERWARPFAATRASCWSFTASSLEDLI